MNATQIQAKDVCEGNEIEGYGVAESDAEPIGSDCDSCGAKPPSGIEADPGSRYVICPECGAVDNSHVRIYFREVAKDLPAQMIVTHWE